MRKFLATLLLSSVAFLTSQASHADWVKSSDACVVAQEYTNNVTVLFGFSDNKFIVSFASDDWNITTESVKVVIKFSDNRETIGVMKRADNNQVVGLFAVETLLSWTKAESFTLFLNGKNVGSFSLAGSGAALKSLVPCIGNSSTPPSSKLDI